MFGWLWPLLKIFESCLLLLNALVILNDQRFLKKHGWGYPPIIHTPEAGHSGGMVATNGFNVTLKYQLIIIRYLFRRYMKCIAFYL